MKTNISFAIPRLSLRQMRAINTLICYRLADLAQANHHRTSEQVAVARQMLEVALKVMQQKNMGRTVRVGHRRDGWTGLGSVGTEGGSGLAAEPRDGPNGYADCVVYAGVPLSRCNLKTIHFATTSWIN